MTEPAWFRSRLSAWRAFKSPPKVSEKRSVCNSCKTEMSATPSGWVCFYCKYDDEPIDLGDLL